MASLSYPSLEKKVIDSLVDFVEYFKCISCDIYVFGVLYGLNSSNTRLL